MDAPRRNTVQSTAAPDLRSSSSREVRLHHREWYASAVDKVMVGKLSCQTNARFRAHGGGDVLQPCLNVALQLHRENYPGLTPNITIHSEMFLLSELQKKKWAKQGRNIPGVSISLQAYRFEVQVSSTRVAMLPATVMTGVVICVSSHASKSRTAQSQQKSSFEQYHHPLSADPVLVCNSADFMHIVLSVESEGNTFDSPTTPQPSTFASGDIHPTLSRLRGAAWDNVARALDKGRTQLKLDHMRHFASFMSRVDISLGSEPSTAAVGATSLHPSGSYTCSSNNLQRRIESFTSGCLNAEFTPPSPYMTADGAVQDNVDARLAGTLFQYGRYLLLSSATGAVANLQGIWADGPTAAWNGDYHLNINFQMHYWAADSVRLKEVMKPLGNFVAQLRKKGKLSYCLYIRSLMKSKH